MYAHSVWLCNDYPVYKPYYDISLEGASREDIPVYGLRTVRMQLTEDPRTEVYVQFVAADVTEPIISYMTLRANGVHVDLSQPEHAIQPCGAKMPLEQHSTYLCCNIYRRIPAKEVADTNNMLTCSGHAGTPLQVCPTYSRSTLRRTTGGNTDYWEFYHQSNTLQGGTQMPDTSTVRTYNRDSSRSVLTKHGLPREEDHDYTLQRYRDTEYTNRGWSTTSERIQEGSSRATARSYLDRLHRLHCQASTWSCSDTTIHSRDKDHRVYR